eukprot:3991-Heterococcus_DN1.PRE.1
MGENVNGDAPAWGADGKFIAEFKKPSSPPLAGNASLAQLRHTVWQWCVHACATAFTTAAHFYSTAALYYWCTAATATCSSYLPATAADAPLLTHSTMYNCLAAAQQPPLCPQPQQQTCRGRQQPA